MERFGYLVYGEPASEAYWGCDAYGYQYNEICQGYMDKADGYWPLAMAQSCAEACAQRREKIRMIFCRASDEDAPGDVSMRFLGFDVAWTEEGFYSSILNEALCERGAMRDQRGQLNACGLFAERAQAEAYLLRRNERKACAEEGKFEGGDFRAVGIWLCHEEK